MGAYGRRWELKQVLKRSKMATWNILFTKIIEIELKMHENIYIAAAKEMAPNKNKASNEDMNSC